MLQADSLEPLSLAPNSATVTLQLPLGVETEDTRHESRQQDPLLLFTLGTTLARAQTNKPRGQPLAGPACYTDRGREHFAVGIHQRRVLTLGANRL